MCKYAYPDFHTVGASTRIARTWNEIESITSGLSDKWDGHDYATMIKSHVIDKDR